MWPYTVQIQKRGTAYNKNKHIHTYNGKKKTAKKQKQQKVLLNRLGWVGGRGAKVGDGGFLLAVCQEIYDERLVDSWKLSSLKSFSFEPRIKSVQSTRGYKLVSTRLNTLIVYKS